MQKLVWKNSLGDEIDLTSGNYGITQWEGFSNASLNIQSQQVPFQDGAVFLDALLNQRELSVTLKMQDNGNLEERYRMRRELIHNLNPKLGEGYLIYTNDFISKRIKCVAQVPLFPTHNSNDSGTPKASLSWTATIPYWEDMEESSIQLQTGEITIIENGGDIPVQMEIEFITGKAVNPAIRCLDNGKKILYNGELNNNLTINTNIGKKQVNAQVLNFDLTQYLSEIKDVCCSANLGLFIAVANNAILKSYDCEKWSFVNTGDYKLNAVTYSNKLNLFVAVGNYGVILTSKDGYKWDTEIGIMESLVDVCYSEELELFVAIGKVILTSPDGINWTEVGEIEDDVSSISYVESYHKFIICGYHIIITSSDGENWTSQSVNYSLRDLIYSEEKDLFVVVGSKTILTSSDGENWTSQSVPYILNGVAFSSESNKFIAVGSNGIIISSNNGTDWNEETSGTSNYLYKIIYSDIYNIFVAVGFYSEIITSTNGVDWTKRINNIEISALNGVCYSNNLKKYIAVGSDGIIIASENGNEWNEETSGINKELFGITYSEVKEIFVAVGDYGVILTSTDGNEWNEETSGVQGKLNCVYYKNELFIVLGNNGIILTSPDGKNWTSRNSGVAVDLYSVVYAQSKYYVVGSGCTLVSLDGILWTTLNNTGAFCITYSENLQIFVEVGYDGIYSSSDGINWNKRNNANLSYITYSKELNMFIAVGVGGQIARSVEGVNWNFMTFPTLTNLNTIIYSNILNQLVCSGDYGIILTSEEGYLQTQNRIQNISADSDLGLNLRVGNNQFQLTLERGSLMATIKYRQKYIGV